MEFALLFLIAGAVLVVPFIALALAVRALHRTQQIDERWPELTARLYPLERRVEELTRNAPQPEKSEERVPPVAATIPPAEQEAPATPPPAPVVAEPEATVAAEAQPEPAIPPAPPPVPAAPEPAPAQPLFSQTFAASGAARPAVSVEETLGTNWLNKLGIIILVIGVSLFLAYQLKTLGPTGKILVGYVVSGSLLAAGILLERRDHYRILARAGIGGGWALLYFTTYAMHHVEAARIISSEAADLLLLLVVAAAMVVHTLRYHSQTVTGLALLLAFTTVAISHVNVYSLSASAILAVSLVVIVLSRQWYELEVFGILATYFNHWSWLRPIIEPMGKHHHPFPEFPASAALLVFYWAVFRSSYVLRKISRENQEAVSTVTALLNAFLLLGVMKYQSIHPELAFWFLLALGAAELGLGQLPLLRKRRAAFAVLSTLGVGLLVAAFPFRYSGYHLSILWLVESEVFFFAGVLTREVIFRRLGMLAGLLVACQMVSVNAAQVFGQRMDGARVVSEPRLGILFGLAAAFFYANAHWVGRRWRDLITTEVESLCFRRLTYLGGAMVLAGAWLTWPSAWTAVAWSALALGQAYFGKRTGTRELLVQAGTLAAAAVIRVLAVNLGTPGVLHHLSYRLISVSLVAALLYGSTRWTAIAEWKRTRPLPAAYTWVASSLVAIVMWYELRPVTVAVGWVILGLILFELGIARGRFSLRLQGCFALGSAFLRLFFVNLNASGNPGELSPRIYTIVPVALALYYAYARLEGGDREKLARDLKFKAPEFFGYAGTIALAALMRFEVGLDWVVVAWAALALGLAAFAWKTGRRMFLHQSIVVGFAVLFRALLHNLYERSYFTVSFWHSRWWSVGPAIALLFLVLPAAFGLRRQPLAGPENRRGLWARFLASLDRHPEQVFFFIPVLLLTVLLAMEMRRGMVTVSWALEAFAVFIFALWVGQRSYRLTGLGLLLLCVVKIVAVDIWGLTPRDRYLTFIILGTLLLAVSFLYTRYREALRRYL